MTRYTKENIVYFRKLIGCIPRIWSPTNGLTTLQGHDIVYKGMSEYEYVGFRTIGTLWASATTSPVMSYSSPFIQVLK